MAKTVIKASFVRVYNTYIPHDRGLKTSYQKEYYDKRRTPEVFSHSHHRLHNNDIAFTQTFIHHHKIFHFAVGAATWDGGTGRKQSTERAKRGETR